MNNELTQTLEQRGRFEATTSERFNNITTSDVMSTLKTLEWEPYSMKAVKSRNMERRPYAKHLVMLKRPNENLTSGSISPRINLRNANDGTASFEIFAGFYRMICSNGLMVGFHYATSKIRHSLALDKLQGAVEEAVKTTENQFTRATSQIESWQNIRLTENQRLNFSEYAVNLRWGGLLIKNNTTYEVQTEMRERAKSLLQIRRSEDNSPSLWETFNVIQENVMNGGFLINSPRMFRGNIQMRSVRSRRLGNIAESVKINRLLWDGAEKIANGEVLITDPFETRN